MARNPKQDANLKPFQKGDLTSEEAKKRGRAGGVKSGESRRAKRDAKSAIRYLEAYTALMRMAGYEPEENRKERESIAADRRREIELDAKVSALGSNPEGMSASVNMSDEDGNNDVVIYMPQIASEESCEFKENEDGKPKDGSAGKTEDGQ